jgi:pectin methylesterase-like acyl-CoA thioesterase
MQLYSLFSIPVFLASLASGRALEQRCADEEISTTSLSLKPSATATIAKDEVTSTAASGTSRTSNPDGCLAVGGSGEYSTLAAALEALGSQTTAQCIFLSAGTYQEQVTIDYAGELTIYGATTE